MILLDYSAISIATIAVVANTDPDVKRTGIDKQYALHIILNSIRRYNKMFRGDYGEMIICCDSPYNWRKKVFEYYKYKRRQEKKKSSLDWDMIYECIEYAKSALSDGFPYLVIEHMMCEADDIIGTLARYATNKKEKTVIVSNDKDFVQLHSDFVCQWRPCIDGYYNVPDIDAYMKEMYIRGDRDDGIPNIKSPYDIFTQEGKRQKPIYKKEIEKWIKDDDLSFLDTPELKARYKRNKILIDLTYTPKAYQKEIINIYENRELRKNKKKMIAFFIKHRLKELQNKLNDF